MEQYSSKVMEHFAHPHNVGEIENADGVGTVGNPVCGDVMRLYLKVEKDTIVDAKFKTFGCGAAIATSSMVTDLVKGKTIDEALKIDIPEADYEKLRSLRDLLDYLQDRARSQARMLVDQAVGHLAQHGQEADLLRALARFIIERDR